MIKGNQVKVVLGDEFDDSLRDDVLDVLRGLGATCGDGEHAIAGSQELEKLTVVIQDKMINVEAETYIGLSVAGPSELVSEIRKLVEMKQMQREGE
jgi:hypothetical protein